MAQREILDRSKSFLDIFTRDIEIDYTLPKFNVLREKTEEDAKKKVEESGSVERMVSSYMGTGYDTPAPINNIPVFEGDKKRKAWIENNKGKLVDEEFFKNLTADDLTIILDENRAKGIKAKFESTLSSLSLSGENFQTSTADSVTSVEPRIIEEPLPGFWNKIRRKTSKRIGLFYKGTDEEVPETTIRTVGQKPTYELDVMKFFDLVKLESTKEIEDYYNRIGSFLVALKKAKQMGQTSLVDKFLGRIFIVKYESILRTKGFHHKISESQLVSFVKKTEKGVSLTYVKNFSHPIPDAVLEKKLQADELHVFDNYVVLHYDPEGKVYSQTQEEKEKERVKKSDPILFGIIAESRELYYITDWVDEYCDLTLDKFLEVSGLDKQSLEIGEKIKI